MASTGVRLAANNSKSLPVAPVWQLSGENLAALKKFIEQLKLKSYSFSPIRIYRNEFLQLLKLLKHRPVNSLQTDDIRRYMVYAMEKEGIIENTAHSRLNALKFYFEQVLGRKTFFHEIPHSKRMTLFVQSAKGKKDRIVGLSPVLLVVLREYAKEFKPDIKGYLFEGSIKGQPYSVRSLQEVLQSAKRNAGVTSYKQ